MTDQNPPVRTEGLGELIRAMRLYTGLSQRELARKINMDRRTYQRIENGQERCPVGFIDTMRKITDEFDEQVDHAIRTAENMIVSMLNPDDVPESDPKVVHIDVTDRDEDAWSRAVIGRAAFESELIMPSLVGNEAPGLVAARAQRAAGINR